jgi:hypothetical protein
LPEKGKATEWIPIMEFCNLRRPSEISRSSACAVDQFHATVSMVSIGIGTVASLIALQAQCSCINLGMRGKGIRHN